MKLVRIQGFGHTGLHTVPRDGLDGRRSRRARTIPAQVTNPVLEARAVALDPLSADTWFLRPFLR